MDKIVIRGGERLIGDVRISGAKNAALPIIAACILADSPCRLDNVPVLLDIKTMLGMVRHLGGTAVQNGHELDIDTSKINSYIAPYELVKTMRASVLVLGPLLAKYGNASV